MFEPNYEICPECGKETYWHDSKIDSVSEEGEIQDEVKGYCVSCNHILNRDNFFYDAFENYIIGEYEKALHEIGIITELSEDNFENIKDKFFPYSNILKIILLSILEEYDRVIEESKTLRDILITFFKASIEAVKIWYNDYLILNTLLMINLIKNSEYEQSVLAYNKFNFEKAQIIEALVKKHIKKDKNVNKKSSSKEASEIKNKIRREYEKQIDKLQNKRYISMLYYLKAYSNEALNNDDAKIDFKEYIEYVINYDIFNEEKFKNSDSLFYFSRSHSDHMFAESMLLLKLKKCEISEETEKYFEQLCFHEGIILELEQFLFKNIFQWMYNFDGLMEHIKTLERKYCEENTLEYRLAKDFSKKEFILPILSMYKLEDKDFINRIMKEMEKIAITSDDIQNANLFAKILNESGREDSAINILKKQSIKDGIDRSKEIKELERKSFLHKIELNYDDITQLLINTSNEEKIAAVSYLEFITLENELRKYIIESFKQTGEERWFEIFIDSKYGIKIKERITGRLSIDNEFKINNLLKEDRCNFLDFSDLRGIILDRKNKDVFQNIPRKDLLRSYLDELENLFRHDIAHSRPIRSRARYKELKKLCDKIRHQLISRKNKNG